MGIAFWRVRKKEFDDYLIKALNEVQHFQLSYVLNTIPFSVWLKDMNYLNGLPLHALLEPNFGFEPGDDHTTQVCRLAMYLKWSEEVHTGVIMTPLTDRRMTLPPKERAEAFLGVCREVFRELSEEQRRIFERLDPVPPPWQFHLNVTHPWLTGRFTKEMFQGLDALMGLPGHENPDDSVERWDLDRERQAAALPSLESRLKPEEEMAHLPPYVLEGLRELNIRPVRDVHVEPEEIPDALRAGKTVVFDATRLCGPEVFNLTVPDLAELHGKLADNIPVLKQDSAGFGDRTYDTLSEIGHRFKTWHERGWQNYQIFGPFPNETEQFISWLHQTPTNWVTNAAEAVMSWYFNVPRHVITLETGKWLQLYRRANTQTTINVRRLPNFPLRDMQKAMGSPGWIERVWNLLWIGPVPDFWHFDEPDNLLIAISGDLYVAVMEQNVTDIVSGTRNFGLGYNNLLPFFSRRKPGEPHWVDSNKWIHKMPIHFLRLRPGMGITVPSRTYHNVMALDGNRVLMNCFFYPKWRAAEDAPSVNYSWWRHGRQADTYRAMFNLKARTLWRLWDTQRVGGFFAGYKLEFF